MTATDHLVEQHVLEHEARLKHIDELLERAGKGAIEQPEYKDELMEIRQEREKLVNHLSELKQQTQDEWQSKEIEQAGPMIIWDAVAKKIEKLIERIEK